MLEYRGKFEKSLTQLIVLNGTDKYLHGHKLQLQGQYDLRLVIDPTNVIDEYDEGNNENYMVVTGAAVSSVINAPSFIPSIGAILACAFIITLIQRNTRD